MLKTSFAGLTALEAGEALSLDGYSFQALNPLIIDRLLKLGARTHRHDEHAGLVNPIDVPTLELVSDGTLPPDADISVGYTLVDSQGGETLMAPVAQVTTSPALEAPDVAPLWDVSALGGHIVAGTYVYVLTLTDPNGETTAGPSFFVNVDPGTDTNMVTISGLTDIVDSVDGATGWRLYKSGATGQPHFLAAGGQSLDYVEDDGLLCADCNVVPPQQNTTSVAQGVEFTVPVTTTNAQTGVVAYRIYASIGGAFESPSFVEQRADFGTLILYRQIVVEPGAPPDVNTSYDGAQKIDPDTEIVDWHWKRPVADESALPYPAEEGDVRVTLDDGEFFVFRTDQWLPFTAPAAYWKAPVASAPDLPLVGNTPGDVRMELETRSLWYYTGMAWVQLTAPPHEIWGLGPYPQQPALQILGEGVAIADDPVNHRTVVTITGSGGGGGGGGPLAMDDKVEWKDARGITRASLAVQRDVIQQDLIVDDYAEAEPVLPWATAYFETDLGLGVGYIAGPAPVDTEFAVRKGWSTNRQIIIDSAVFTLVNDDWATVGVGITIGDEVSSIGIEWVINNTTKQAILRRRMDGGVAWITIVDPVDVTGLYEVGDELSVSLSRDGDTLGYSVYNQTRGEAVVPWGDPVAVPVAMLDFEGQPSMVFKVTDRAAITVKEYQAYLAIDNYSIMGYVVGAYDSTNAPLISSDDPNEFDPWGVTGAGWSAPSYRRVNGMLELSGRFMKYDGVAPVADEIMLTVTNGLPFPGDITRLVSSGDVDGVEQGALRFDYATNTVRWVSGRSTDPATKYPFLDVDGQRFTA